MSTLKNLIKVKELRNKILFTLFIIALYRLGTHVPVPGIDVEQLRTLRTSANGNGGVARYLTTYRTPRAAPLQRRGR